MLLFIIHVYLISYMYIYYIYIREHKNGVQTIENEIQGTIGF